MKRLLDLTNQSSERSRQREGTAALGMGYHVRPMDIVATCRVDDPVQLAPFAMDDIT